MDCVDVATGARTGQDGEIRGWRVEMGEAVKQRHCFATLVASYPLIFGKAPKAVRQFHESALIQLERVRTAMARYHGTYYLPCTGELVHRLYGMADSDGIIGQPWPVKLR